MTPEQIKQALARGDVGDSGIDLSRMAETIAQHLHAAYVPTWTLTPGLQARGEPDGLVIMSAEADDLVTIPWSAIPTVG